LQIASRVKRVTAHAATVPVVTDLLALSLLVTNHVAIGRRVPGLRAEDPKVIGRRAIAPTVPGRRGIDLRVTGLIPADHKVTDHKVTDHRATGLAAESRLPANHAVIVPMVADVVAKVPMTGVQTIKVRAAKARVANLQVAGE
jgi:hypothetical protein